MNSYPFCYTNSLPKMPIWAGVVIKYCSVRMTFLNYTTDVAPCPTQSYSNPRAKQTKITVVLFASQALNTANLLSKDQ